MAISAQELQKISGQATNVTTLLTLLSRQRSLDDKYAIIKTVSEGAHANLLLQRDCLEQLLNKHFNIKLTRKAFIDFIGATALWRVTPTLSPERMLSILANDEVELDRSRPGARSPLGNAPSQFFPETLSDFAKELQHQPLVDIIAFLNASDDQPVRYGNKASSLLLIECIGLIDWESISKVNSDPLLFSQLFAALLKVAHATNYINNGIEAERHGFRPEVERALQQLVGDSDRNHKLLAHEAGKANFPMDNGRRWGWFKESLVLGTLAYDETSILARLLTCNIRCMRDILNQSAINTPNLDYLKALLENPFASHDFNLQAAPAAVRALSFAIIGNGILDDIDPNHSIRTFQRSTKDQPILQERAELLARMLNAPEYAMTIEMAQLATHLDLLSWLDRRATTEAAREFSPRVHESLTREIEKLCKLLMNRSINWRARLEIIKRMVTRFSHDRLFDSLNTDHLFNSDVFPRYFAVDPNAACQLLIEASCTSGRYDDFTYKNLTRNAFLVCQQLSPEQQLKFFDTMKTRGALRHFQPSWKTDPLFRAFAAYDDQLDAQYTEIWNTNQDDPISAVLTAAVRGERRLGNHQSVITDLLDRLAKTTTQPKYEILLNTIEELLETSGIFGLVPGSTLIQAMLFIAQQEARADEMRMLTTYATTPAAPAQVVALPIASAPEAPQQDAQAVIETEENETKEQDNANPTPNEEGVDERETYEEWAVRKAEHVVDLFDEIDKCETPDELFRLIRALGDKVKWLLHSPKQIRDFLIRTCADPENPERCLPDKLKPLLTLIEEVAPQVFARSKLIAAILKEFPANHWLLDCFIEHCSVQAIADALADAETLTHINAAATAEAAPAYSANVATKLANAIALLPPKQLAAAHSCFKDHQEISEHVDWDRLHDQDDSEQTAAEDEAIYQRATSESMTWSRTRRTFPEFLFEIFKNLHTNHRYQFINYRAQGDALLPSSRLSALRNDKRFMAQAHAKEFVLLLSQHTEKKVARLPRYSDDIKHDLIIALYALTDLTSAEKQHRRAIISELECLLFKATDIYYKLVGLVHLYATTIDKPYKSPLMMTILAGIRALELDPQWVPKSYGGLIQRAAPLPANAPEEQQTVVTSFGTHQEYVATGEMVPAAAALPAAAATSMHGTGLYHGVAASIAAPAPSDAATASASRGVTQQFAPPIVVVQPDPVAAAAEAPGADISEEELQRRADALGSDTVEQPAAVATQVVEEDETEAVATLA